MTQDRATRALLADDTWTQRLAVAHALEAAGVRVVAVKDGLEAVEAFVCDSFDVVVLDVNMPHLDGFDTLAAIRGTAPVLPVVVVSAETSNESRALELGATRFVAKTAGFEAKVKEIVVALLAREKPLP